MSNEIKIKIPDEGLSTVIVLSHVDGNYYRVEQNEPLVESFSFRDII